MQRSQLSRRLRLHRYQRLSENGNAETAAEIAGIANDAVSAETAAEIIPEQPKAAGKKHKKKKHRKSAGASDNSKGGADK